MGTAIYYKFLKKGGFATHVNNFQYELPSKRPYGKIWKPGKWMPIIEGDLEKCANGYHVCREKDLLDWIHEECYVVEVRGDIVEFEDKVIARQVRLLRKLKWDDRSSRLFACDCAERVLYLYEKDYPGDSRVRDCIETARQFARGEVAAEKMAAARAAAWAAAWDAARAAAWAAAWDAAWDAARAAAWDAARAAARDAARDAAWDAEKQWQIEKIMEYIKA